MWIVGHSAGSCKLAVGCMSDTLLACIRVIDLLLAICCWWRVCGWSSAHGVQCVFVPGSSEPMYLDCLHILTRIFWDLSTGDIELSCRRRDAGSPQICWCILQVNIFVWWHLHKVLLSAQNLRIKCIVSFLYSGSTSITRTTFTNAVASIWKAALGDFKNGTSDWNHVTFSWTGSWHTVCFIKQWPTPNVAAKVGSR